jgi:hypothetical protein
VKKMEKKRKDKGKKIRKVKENMDHKTNEEKPSEMPTARNENEEG